MKNLYYMHRCVVQICTASFHLYPNRFGAAVMFARMLSRSGVQLCSGTHIVRATSDLLGWGCKCLQHACTSVFMPKTKKKETYFLTNPFCNACSIAYLPCFLNYNALLYRQKAYMAHSVKVQYGVPTVV